MNDKSLSIHKDTLDDDFYEDENTQKDMFFTFQVGKEEYGISISYVNEVIGLQKITKVPDMPDFIKGVINLRGKVIPVMDVRHRFQMEAIPYNDRTCVVVIDLQDNPIGLVVDAVSDVVDIPADKIDPPPQLQASNSKKFIKGMGKINDEIKILLDIDKLLYDEEVESIAALNY